MSTRASTPLVWARAFLLASVALAASRTRLVLLLVTGQALVHAALTLLGGHHHDGVQQGPALAPLLAGRVTPRGPPYACC